MKGMVEGREKKLLRGESSVCEVLLLYKRRSLHPAVYMPPFWRRLEDTDNPRTELTTLAFLGGVAPPYPRLFFALSYLRRKKTLSDPENLVPYAKLNEEAEAVPIGCEGLVSQRHFYEIQYILNIL